MYFRCTLAILVCGVFNVPALAQFEAIEYRLVASDGAAHDEFGHSVSLSGDRAIVGAHLDNDQSGSAYIFERQGDDTWQEVFKLTAGDGEAEDWFGYSTSLSGNRAIVGAWRDDDQGTESGSAYVYERQGDGSWQELAKLTAISGDPGDFFGYSVSLSGDYAIVGARGEGGLFEQGAAYIFERQGDDTWQQVVKFRGAEEDWWGWFGASVALFAGSRALVGAPGAGDNGFQSGSVHVYERQGNGIWLEVEELQATDGDGGDRFGSSVSLAADRAIAGAFFDEDSGSESGSAYVFERQGDGTWLEAAKLNASDGLPFDRFGTSVSISGDRAIVGSYLHDDSATDAGSAYIYLRQGDGSWTEVGELTASDVATGDRFGVSVSISGDRALLGAYWDDDLGTNSGSAYLFDNIFPTAVELAADLPQGYLLSAPYPNPFNPRAVVPFEVPEAAHVRLTLVDIFGREVAILLDRQVAAGSHEAVVDGGLLASGVYLVRLEAEGVVRATQKVVLLR